MNNEIKIHDIWRDDLDNREVVVSIKCIVYNHERYIRDTLEGFVMQKTNFRFEAIVHDDASTDGTAAIIREYAEKYPSIIKPIFEDENQYSKKDGTLTRIVNAHLRGRYIAFCEGDDFWTDPLKLQRQVDFLERNKEYSMCFHFVKEKIEDGQVVSEIFSHLKGKDYTAREIYEKWTVPTCSIVGRGEVIRSFKYGKGLLVGDLVAVLNLSAHGKMKCIDEYMAIYRRTSVSWMSTNRTSLAFAERNLVFRERLIDLYPQYEAFIKPSFIKANVQVVIKAFAEMKYKRACKTLLLGLSRFKWRYVKYLCGYPVLCLFYKYKSKR